MQCKMRKWIGKETNWKMYVEIFTDVYDSLLVYESLSIILLKNDEKNIFTSKSMVLVSSFLKNNFLFDQDTFVTWIHRDWKKITSLWSWKR